MSARARTARGRTAVIGALAAVLVVSGCSGPTSDWRFQGKPLHEVEESLATMTETWRSAMTSEGVEVAIPEDAGCYLQVADDELVGEELLCGPMAFMGAEATQWVVAPLSAMQTKDDSVRLVLDEEPAWDLGTANPNSVPVDAEGTEADLEQQVEPPSAPPAEMGQVIPLEIEEIEAAEEPYELVTVDATYSITTLGVVPQVGPATDPVGAPEGGSLITVGVSRQGHQGVPTSPTSKAVLTVGGAEIDVPEETSAIAVEGDGSDAVIAVDYDGNTQEYELATGELVGGRPFSARQFEPVNAPERELIGDESEGESASYRFRLDGGTTSWSESEGWAADGKDRMFMDLSFESDIQFANDGDTVPYDDKTYSLASLSVTADGEEVAVDPKSIDLAPRADGDFENLGTVASLALDVPADAEEITIAATVDVKAVPVQDEITNYMREHTDGEPESISKTLELTEVTLKPQGANS